MERTLMLNAAYLPLGVVSWTKAVCLLWQAKVEVVQEGPRTVSSPSVTMKVPSIIRLRSGSGRRVQRIRLSRRNLFHRDGYTCQYCGRRLASRELNIDHVVPRARGGRSHWGNLVTACVADNTRKGGRTPEEAGMRLIRQPESPAWTAAEALHASLQGSMPEGWRIYLRIGKR